MYVLEWTVFFPQNVQTTQDICAVCHSEYYENNETVWDILEKFHLGCIMCEPHVHRETRRFLYVHIHTWKSTEKG